MMDQILADLCFAIRSFRVRTGLTVTILCILTLAIGAVTATYSLLDWVILRPLPYPDAQHIFSVGFPQDTRDERPIACLNDFDRLKTASIGLDLIAASRWNSGTLLSADDAEQLDEDIVSPEFFRLLGAQTLIGRPFAPADYQASAAPVALLSYDLWQRRFHGDRKIIGRPITIDSQSRTVIGVLRPTFHDPLEYRRHTLADLWLPLVRTAADDRIRLYSIYGHLARGYNPDQLRAAIHAIAFDAEPKEQNKAQVLELQRSLTGSFQLQLFLLTGAVSLLLLIACANVGGLLLTRGASLEGEMAVRLALGANRRRLIQQQLTEMLALSVSAGILGVLFASLLLRSISKLIPLDLPRASEAHVDARIALFALAASLFTVVACGLWPAIRSSGTQLSQSIRGAAAGLSGSRQWRRLGAAFVVLQIALSFVLLAGASVLVKSFWLLTNVDAGFAAKHILTMQVRLPRSRYSRPEQRSAFYASALSKLSSLPGIESAALVTTLPLAGSAFSEAFLVQDHPVASDAQRPQANWNLVSPSYFQTFHIALIAGRFPTEDDLQRSKDIVVINRYIADQYWPHQNAIGKYVRFGSVNDSGHWSQVIGVVDDVKHHGLDSPAEPQIYELYPALPPPYGYFVLRTKAVAAGEASTARQAIRLLDRDVPVDKVTSMSSILSASVAAPRFRTELLASFGFFAVILSAFGLYGAIAYSVARRQREMGIRMAIGASPQAIRHSLLASAGKLVMAGLLLGFGGAIAFVTALRSFLFSVQPFDASALLTSLGLLAVVGIMAALIPAQRAAEIDPAAALHES